MFLTLPETLAGSYFRCRTRLLGERATSFPDLIRTPSFSSANDCFRQFIARNYVSANSYVRHSQQQKSERKETDYYARQWRRTRLDRRPITPQGRDPNVMLAPMLILSCVPRSLRRRGCASSNWKMNLSEALSNPPKKRARKNDEVTTSAPSTPPPSALSKAHENKRKMQVKRVFGRLKKECKSETVKFQGSPKAIKFDEVYEQGEFEVLFGGKGLLIQPTPQNKPKSAVTIIHFATQSQIESFLGDGLKALKGNRWSRVGMPVRTFGGGFGSKSVKLGACDVSIRSLEVKNKLKCTLKFDVCESGGHDDYDSNYY